MGLLDRLRVPLSWLGVIRRTSQRTLQDNCLGLAAELDRLTDHVLGALDRFAPPDVLSLIRDQLLQISKNDNGGLLTLGLVGTVWARPGGVHSPAMGTLTRLEA